MQSLYDDSGAGIVWNWNATNFHPDDVMDESYTDPSLYSPVYDLAQLPNDTVEVITASINNRHKYKIKEYFKTKMLRLRVNACNTYPDL